MTLFKVRPKTQSSPSEESGSDDDQSVSDLSTGASGYLGNVRIIGRNGSDISDLDEKVKMITQKILDQVDGVNSTEESPVQRLSQGLLTEDSPVGSSTVQSPLDSSVESPVQSPLDSSVDSPVGSSTVQSPLDSPVDSSSIQSPLESPLQSPLESPLQSPLESSVDSVKRLNIELSIDGQGVFTAKKVEVVWAKNLSTEVDLERINEKIRPLANSALSPGPVVTEPLGPNRLKWQKQDPSGTRLNNAISGILGDKTQTVKKESNYALVRWVKKIWNQLCGNKPEFSTYKGFTGLLNLSQKLLPENQQLKQLKQLSENAKRISQGIPKKLDQVKTFFLGQVDRLQGDGTVTLPLTRKIDGKITPFYVKVKKKR